jgi:hypothetical protein
MNFALKMSASREINKTNEHQKNIDELPHNIIKTIRCQSEANKKITHRSLHSRNYSSAMKFSTGAFLLIGAAPGVFGVEREVRIVMASTYTAVRR